MSLNSAHLTMYLKNTISFFCHVLKISFTNMEDPTKDQELVIAVESDYVMNHRELIRSDFGREEYLVIESDMSKSIITFNLHDLPENALIKEATLKLRSARGNDEDNDLGTKSSMLVNVDVLPQDKTVILPEDKTWTSDNARRVAHFTAKGMQKDQTIKSYNVKVKKSINPGDKKVTFQLSTETETDGALYIVSKEGHENWFGMSKIMPLLEVIYSVE